MMLFVSGHGINEGPNYRFVPTDAAFGTGGVAAARPAWCRGTPSRRR